MAERALYQNYDEPDFPIEKIAPSLNWLSAYIDEVLIQYADSKDRHEIFTTLIDTVLVFARARTSALHNVKSYKVCASLVPRLNRVLQSVGATHHTLELVRRGSNIYFITCSRSPRFIWKTRLTHREIGRNLDFFAAGHYRGPPFPPRGFISYIERNSLDSLTAEVVYLEYVDDDNWKKLVAFHSAKESLFNAVMASLNLSFRFKWVFDCPEKRAEVAKLMQSPSPPSSEWWENYCVWVTGFGNENVVPDSGRRFCNYCSRFNEFWPLIRRAHEFIIKYRTVEFWYACQGTEYWENGSKLLGEIKEELSPAPNDQAPDVIINAFSKRLEQLATSVESLIRAAPADNSNHSDVSVANSTNRLKLPRLLQWRTVKKGAFMYIFERYKLQPRLVFKSIDAPSEGDTVATFLIW